jgi:hypothetical protein
MDLHLDAGALAAIAFTVPLAVNRVKQWERIPSWSLPWLCVLLGALGEAAYSALAEPGGVGLSDLFSGALAGAAGLWGREAVDQGVKARRRAVRDRDLPRPAELDSRLRRTRRR